MASSSAVAIAAFLQIILRMSFFIEQRTDLCSTAPTLASWIFLIAFLDVLLEVCIYPVRYLNLPYICEIIGETFITILLAEFGTLMVWCTIEKITCKFCKTLLLIFGMSPNFYYGWENYILGVATTSTSLAILFLVGEATDHFHFMRKRSLRICRRINTKILHTCCKIRSMLKTKRFDSCNDIADCGESECFDLNSEIFYRGGRKNKKRNRSRNRQSRSRSRNRRAFD